MDDEKRLQTTVVAVVSPTDHKTLEFKPSYPGVKFLIANDFEQFKAFPEISKTAAVLWIPPGDVTVLDQLWDYVKGSAQWVHSFFAGVDRLTDFTKKHLVGSDIPLTNGRGAFSSSLAEYAMAAILHYNKQIPRIQSNTAQGKWDKFVMNVVKGKTLGLIGFGHIAQATARLAKPFGIKIVAVRRSPEKGTCSGLADQVVGFDKRLDVFSTADFVVSVLPGTKETKNFCGKEEFEAMKSTGVFINIGRGITVDEAALCQALNEQKIAGAALDVFWEEPLPSKSPLWGCKNLLITAHNADFTEDYAQLGWKVWEDNLKTFLSGAAEDQMATPVHKKDGY